MPPSWVRVLFAVGVVGSFVDVVGSFVGVLIAPGRVADLSTVQSADLFTLGGEDPYMMGFLLSMAIFFVGFVWAGLETPNRLRAEREAQLAIRQARQEGKRAPRALAPPRRSLAGVHVRAQRAPGQHCPYCRDDLDAHPLTCLSCGTLMHAECMEEAGGCTTLGCSEAPVRGPRFELV